MWSFKFDIATVQHLASPTVEEPNCLASSPDFTAIFGGWPNSLQGLGSALIGGLVAALTAYVVVRLTANDNRNRALEDEARLVARDLLRAVSKNFVGVSDKQELRVDHETAGVLNLELRFAAAVLEHYNAGLAKHVENQANYIEKKAEHWKTALPSDTDAPARYNDMLHAIEKLQDPVIDWLKSPARPKRFWRRRSASR
ncbi:hypothetical protein ACWDUN_04020 [Mycobacterium sp. NPDC003323]